MRQLVNAQRYIISYEVQHLNLINFTDIERRQVDLPDGPVVNEPPPFNGKAIPGDAGIDYPIFGEVPRTAFSCKDHKWPGYYADTQARCQVMLSYKLVPYQNFYDGGR